jgi:pyruvate formate lyase activating enzyme
MLYAEFVSKTFKLAHQHGLYTVLKTSAMVSSGLFTMVLEDTDACCIDIKGDASRYKESCGADEKSLDLLYENLQLAHLITNLELSVMIRGEESRIHSVLTDISGMIGALTPIHLIAFVPSFKETNASPTPLNTMGMAQGIGKIYFEYVYDENANSQTICRSCYTTLLKRNGGVVSYNALKGNACPCGTPLWKNTCATITNAQNAKPSSK